MQVAEWLRAKASADVIVMDEGSYNLKPESAVQ